MVSGKNQYCWHCDLELDPVSPGYSGQGRGASTTKVLLLCQLCSTFHFSTKHMVPYTNKACVFLFRSRVSHLMFHRWTSVCWSRCLTPVLEQQLGEQIWCSGCWNFSNPRRPKYVHTLWTFCCWLKRPVSTEVTLLWISSHWWI